MLRFCIGIKFKFLPFDPLSVIAGESGDVGSPVLEGEVSNFQVTSLCFFEYITDSF